MSEELKVAITGKVGLTKRRNEVVAACLAVGKNAAVVSHESAIHLLGLSNVIPNHLHFSAPCAKRYLPTQPGVTIHTTTKPLQSATISVRGVRLTSPTRTILDAAEAGIGPEQIELAVKQAVERGLTTRTLLQEAAQERSKRTAYFVASALDQVTR